MCPITVAIADCDLAACRTCEALLRPQRDIWVLAQTATLEAVMDITTAFQPRILLCGFGFGFGFGLAAAAGFDLLLSLHRQCPATRVLLLTRGDEAEELIMQALNLGARGYLGLVDLRWQLFEALHRVDEGEIWMPRQLLGQLLERAAGAASSLV